METKLIKINPDTARLIINVLETKEGYYPDCGRDEIIFKSTAVFKNGIEADIKVCNGDTPYVDPVLFDDGSQACTLEVTDSFFGEYIFAPVFDCAIIADTGVVGECA